MVARFNGFLFIPMGTEFISVLRDRMHGNSMGIYSFACFLYTPICSTSRQCTWFRSRIIPCFFNRSLHHEKKDKGQNDWNNRVNPSKKGTIIS